MPEVTVLDMMLRREERFMQQEEILHRHGTPVLSFCLNIPGPVKTDPEIRSAFEEGKKEILSALAERNWNIVQEFEIHEKTGDEWIAGIPADAAELKETMCRIEETHPLGRLFDIDVIAPDGQKLSRPEFRTCLICGRQAQDCARSRRHSANELFHKVKALIREEL